MSWAARRSALEEAQRHFLRAAERCLTAVQEPAKATEATAEALFFGALGLFRAAEGDDEREAAREMMIAALEQAQKKRAG